MKLYEDIGDDNGVDEISLFKKYEEELLVHARKVWDKNKDSAIFNKEDALISALEWFDEYRNIYIDPTEEEYSNFIKYI